MDIYEQITKMADEIAPELVAQRRDFHKFAEKGWFEMRTSSIIARKLTEMGYEVSVGDQVCKKDARMGVPSDEELEEQYLAGNLLADLTLKDSRSFRKELERIIAEVF